MISEERLVDFIGTHQPIKNAEIMSANALSYDEFRPLDRMLQRLRKKGLIKYTKSGWKARGGVK